MITTNETILERARIFMIVIAAALTCAAIFSWTAVAVLYLSGHRYEATVLNSPKTDINTCSASFFNSRKSWLPNSVIEMGTFTSRVADLGREYSHFIIGIPTHSRPCSFPFRAGTIISIKIAPIIPIAYIETHPLLNLHLPLFLSVLGALGFWIAKVLGSYL